MCGILSVYNKKGGPANELMAKIYDSQKHRGRDGFGFAEINDNSVILKRFVLEDDFLNNLKESKSSEIIAHHRIPTSTTNNVKSNHPIYSIDCEIYAHNYYLQHNGHIMNSVELRREHEKCGIKYNSDEGDEFTDSESLLHELALIIEGHNKADEFAAKGGMAFIMVQTDKDNNPTALYFGRNGNPLKINNDENALILRSEAVAAEDVEINKLFKYDYNTKEITSEDVKFSRLIKSEGWTRTNNELTNVNLLADLIGKVYENNFVGLVVLDDLKNEELNMLLVIACRVASKQLMEIERGLLTLSDADLIVLRCQSDITIKSINSIKYKLK